MAHDLPISTTFGKLIEDGLLEIGDGYRAKNKELGGDGPLFLRAGHVTDTHIDFAGVERFDSKLTDKLAPKMSRPGDTIMTTKGNSTGRTSYVTEGMPEFVYSPHLSYWRSLDPKTIVPGFLRYWSRGKQFREQLSGMKVSTDMAPYLSLTDQRRLVITVPEVSTQRLVAETLGTLDDKIDLNRRMNQTLESLARAIFKAWFVDFEPVKAKAAGATSFPGMPREVFEELPGEMVESEVGLVPTGWELKPIPELFEVNPSRRLSKGTVALYLEMSNMPTHGHAPDKWVPRPFSSGMRFINGDTLVARITPCLENGKTAFVDFLENDEVGWGSTEYIVLRPKPPLPSIFGYCLARTSSFRDFLIQNMSGTSGRQRVPATALEHFQIAEPPAALAKLFDEVTRLLFAKAKNNRVQSKILGEARDALLPKLLSGKIRVPEKFQKIG